MIRADGVAERHVASNAFIETGLGKDSEGTGKVFFAVLLFLFFGGKRWPSGHDTSAIFGSCANSKPINVCAFLVEDSCAMVVLMGWNAIRRRQVLIDDGGGSHCPRCDETSCKCQKYDGCVEKRYAVHYYQAGHRL